jgi:hypothetical protein
MATYCPTSVSSNSINGKKIDQWYPPVTMSKEEESSLDAYAPLVYYEYISRRDPGCGKDVLPGLEASEDRIG